MDVQLEGERTRKVAVEPRRDLSLLRASCWLALFLVAAKAATWTARKFPGLTTRLLELLMSTWTDVLFALCCGALAELAIFALPHKSRTAAFARGAVIGFFALCALYGVAAVGLFHYFNRPLTFELLGLIGNATVVRSSIWQRLSLVLAFAIVLVPLVFVSLAIWGGRKPRSTAIAWGIAVLWTVAGWSLYRTAWKEEYVTHIWLSPHTELFRTAALHFTGGQRPKFPKDFPPQDMDEFRTFGARGVQALSTYQPPPGVARPKNLIVIVLESVGTKYLSLYGSPLEVAPNLAAESRNALVFDNIYAHASFTYCAFRTLQFSVYPGLPWHYALLAGSPRSLPGTLASALRARGARTAYINNGNLDWEDQRWLLECSNGFQSLDDYSSLGCPPLSSWGTEDRCVFDRVIRWIDEKPGEPFFAFCWTDQSHDPYPRGAETTPIDFFGDKPPRAFPADLSRYLNVVHETDAQMGRMFAALRERGLADDTLVVVTGDHGEAFADPHEQRGHAWSVYEEEVHVPLMLWNPRLFPEGGRSQAIGGQVDLNATLADLLELEPEKEWQGHSLFDPARPDRAFFMAIAGGDVFGVRDGEWKYIYDVTSGHESLFQLGNDPEEQHDVVGNEPERAKRMRQRVAAWVTFEDAFLWGREN